MVSAIARRLGFPLKRPEPRIRDVQQRRDRI